MELANKELRKTMRIKKVPMWKIAKELGCCELTITRMFREELSKEKRAEILKIIEKLA